MIGTTSGQTISQAVPLYTFNANTVDVVSYHKAQAVGLEGAVVHTDTHHCAAAQLYPVEVLVNTCHSVQALLGLNQFTVEDIVKAHSWLLH